MNAGQKRAEKKKRELTLQRENRLEEQEQLIRELKARIQELEAQNRNLSESFNTISNSTCWKITKPVRVVMDAVKSMLSPHCRKGLYSLRTNDVPGTSQKTVHEFRRRGDPAQPDRQRLFSEPELKAQREHAFPQAIRFSVVVPLYNTPKRFLRSMIECVLAQTYADWELCMADGSDGEHSDVEQICLEYAEKDRRIRYRKLEKNLGISGNTNACLEMAQGDYIGLFDHDDLLHPAALYEVMRAIEKTGADFIYTDEAVFESPNIKKSPTYILSRILRRTICGPTTIFVTSPYLNPPFWMRSACSIRPATARRITTWCCA